MPAAELCSTLRCQLVNPSISRRYATFCEIAGVDPTDTAAAAAGLPPIDSISAAPLLGLVDGSTGKGSRWKQAAARTEIHLSSMALLDSDGWKLVTGVQPQTGTLHLA